MTVVAEPRAASVPALVRPKAHDRLGLAACITSAVAFGCLPILGKVALDDGANASGLLWARFSITAAALWGLVALIVPADQRPWSRSAPRPAVLAGLAMGALGYAFEAALFFMALERIDASLTELLLYAYPGLVTLAALRRGARRPGRRTLGALGLSSAGLVLVLGGSVAAGVDSAGLALGLAAAVVYAGYVLVGERVVADVHPLVVAALVATGAAAAFTAAGTAGADLRLPSSGGGLAVVAVVAVGATVVPMVALFVGISRVGAPTASVVSTLEPVVAVVLAVALLGEQLTAVEALGAAAVLAAVWRLGAAGVNA